MGYFLALDIPDNIVRALNDFILPAGEGVRKQRREDLHITLAYIGDVPDDRYDNVLADLQAIALSPFSVSGQGGCYFGPGPSYRNHFFAADINLTPPLQELKDQIDSACLKNGLEPRRHENRYRPHITLARSDEDIGQNEIDRFVTDNAEKSVPPFDVLNFALYSSRHPGPYFKHHDFDLKH